MTLEIPRSDLRGKKALIVGVASEYSIEYGCAAAFHELGADVAITYLNEKAKAYFEPLAQKLEAPIFMPLDVSKPGDTSLDPRGAGAARCSSERLIHAKIPS